MNPYFKNLEKIEFIVTYACTGNCRHCSQGDHKAACGHIEASKAADAVIKTASEHEIKTVMTFGGEPLLYPEAVYKIMKAAKEMNVVKRQVITNGYFSKDADTVKRVAEELADCGVNDLLLSADAFHAECIPLEAVKLFASALLKAGVPVRTQPAWLVDRDDRNPYNDETRRILAEFEKLGISASDGNVIFPEGNALIHLSDYFVGQTAANPYVEDPNNIRCISFEPDGTVLGDNFYQRDITDIIENYHPDNAQ